jgi:hypothetical protein
MDVITCIFMHKIESLDLSFSHLYQKTKPLKYANNRPKRCALVSRVNEQNLVSSLGLV